MSLTPHLGIDFGGVIVPMLDTTRRGERPFSDRFLARSPHEGAFQKIRSLGNAFGGKVWIVSKADEQTESLTRQWLHNKGFWDLTGLEENHLRFCRERVQKEPICVELGITHFIDDRVHVMQILRDTVHNLYLFGDKSRHYAARRWTTLVQNWAEAHEAILGDVQRLQR